MKVISLRLNRREKNRSLSNSGLQCRHFHGGTLKLYYPDLALLYDMDSHSQNFVTGIIYDSKNGVCTMGLYDM